MSTIKHIFTTETNATQTILEKFIHVPGLQHLAENIFLNLNYQDLEACRLTKISFKHFLDQFMENSLFWMEKFISGGMSKKNQMDWMEIIQMTRGTNVGKSTLLYLKLYFKNERFVDFDVPCYIKKDSLEKYSEIITKVQDINFSIVSYHYYHEEIVKILDPFVDKKFREEDEISPIHWAACNGHTEIIKILAPLADNPNAPDKNGRTPLYYAALLGQTEVVKILAPLTENPNAPDKNGTTPICQAAMHGHTEVVKFMAPLTDNANASDQWGITPIITAAVNGYTEIVKILAPLTDNPNAPDENGDTPIYLAAHLGHIEIVKFLAPLTDNPNVL